jgi:lipopolysaccharide/colanic/teichoic acid biosynthesis glycosyltransferase
LDELIGKLEKHLQGSSGRHRARLVARLVAKKWAWLVVIGGSRATKRVFDLVAGCLLLLASVPVFALLAAVIKLDSPGPVLFNQVRVGRNGVLFIMYKFRTMRTDAEKLKQELMEHNEAGGVIFKMKRDPRITRVGRILRKLSLDELPQVMNVVRGEMSIVGPRPPVPSEVAEYTPADRRRLEARPGLTCLWQVSGRSDIPFDGQVSLDVEYIETRSLWQDLVILVRTVPAVLLGKGAY